MHVYRNYDKAMRAVVAMRKAAEGSSQEQSFNSFLADLASRYEHDRQHSSFWKSTVREGIMLLGNATEAEKFFKEHSGAQVRTIICVHACISESIVVRERR